MTFASSISSKTGKHCLSEVIYSDNTLERHRYAETHTAPLSKTGQFQLYKPFEGVT